MPKRDVPSRGSQGTPVDKSSWPLGKKIESVCKKVCAELTQSDLESLQTQSAQEIDALREELHAQTVTIKQLNEDKQKLREVILGNTARQKVSDDVIKQRFASIRQQIQVIANNSALDVNRPLPAYLVTRDPFEIDFQQRYTLYSPADRTFLVRSKVYEIIYCWILGKDVFGVVSSYQKHPRVQNFKDGVEVRFEQFLGNFEGHLRKSDNRYCFRHPDIGNRFGPDKGHVEPCGVLGGGEMSTVIAFTICGALMKDTGEGTENSVCLEPAHVVVQPRTFEGSSDVGAGPMV
ncbi:hypothetical protein E4U42_000335 [Claviceps africana]|uniref:Uncharacterized protein n=1 Tax=Claviceps africana TaxID=83212 RepID=A0A8K0NNB5_9HYPO|nr:hypothetical protein E4U42_000335 [Claviceps africana]